MSGCKFQLVIDTSDKWFGILTTRSSRFSLSPFALFGQLAQKKDLLEVEIRDLAIGIEDIKNEQEYTIARERSHRDSKSELGKYIFSISFRFGLHLPIRATNKYN